MPTTTAVPLAAIDAFVPRLPAPGTADVTIEVLGSDIGDQVEVRRMPWHGLIHDPVSRVIEVSVGARDRSMSVALRHEIHEPSQLWVEEDDGSVVAMSIEHGDGLTTIVTFHRHAAIEPDDGNGAPPALLPDA